MHLKPLRKGKRLTLFYLVTRNINQTDTAQETVFTETIPPLRESRRPGRNVSSFRHETNAVFFVAAHARFLRHVCEGQTSGFF